MGRGADRTAERIAASFGKISEAAIEFENVKDVSNGGVLFALPALLANGLLQRTKEYFSLPKGYYGLSSIFITLAFIVLLRIKSLEGIRYIAPGELGKLVGLDRIPEVRTIREKMDLLVENGKVKEWQSFLSELWMISNPELAGVLYIDGHIRAYHGKQTKLPKRYVARDRLCLRGMSAYWVNDALGQPFFVISTPLTDGLLSMLRKDIIPRLLEEVPNQPSQEHLKADPLLLRFVIVFDREGYSPEFFLEMKQMGIGCHSYKKYPGENWNEQEFSEQEVTLGNGEKVVMKLAERGVFLANKLWVREIRKLTESGHQTSLVSTDFRSDRGQIAVALFSRWSQENFFKYMIEHFGIDRLMEYETTAIDETLKVVNPEYRELDSLIKSKNGKLSRMLAKFGSLTLSDDIDEKKIQKYERQKAELQEEITFCQKQIIELKDKRKGIARHITFGELPQPERFEQLADKKKNIWDTIKMIAYRAETALANIIKPEMSRIDEARGVIRQIFKTEVDIKPDEKKGILEVLLHNLTNPYSDRLAKELCTKLNETETIFPGTNLRMVYKLVSDNFL